jgi:AcrR family transcriptional regulator
MVAASGRRPGRRPGPSETRPVILAAARELFAEKGFDGASIRAIARAAEVDPALVHHFFGNKEALFVAAMEFPFDPTVVIPQVIASGPREEIGERLVRAFLGLWSDDALRARALAVFRSAATSDQGADMFREFLTSAMLARVSELLELPRLRILVAIGQMIGVVIMRYLLEIEPIASATDEELVELLAPTLQRYLGGE